MSVQMREITEEDYEEFLKKHKEVVFEDNVSGKRIVIKLEGTTVWSFPQRGTWATHRENTNIMCLYLGDAHEDTKLFPHIRFKS